MSRSRVIAAGSEELWGVISDPHHLPRWWPGVERVEEVSEAGWTKVLRSERGKVIRADFTRVEAHSPRHLTWRQELEDSPFERMMSESVTELTLDPADGGEDGTRVELRATQRLRGLARFGGFIVRRATRRQLDAALARLDGLLGARPDEEPR